MTASRQLKAEETGAATGVKRIERRAPLEDESQDAVPRGTLGGGADAVAKGVVESWRPAAPMGSDLLLDDVSLSRIHAASLLCQADHRGQRFQLLGVVGDGIEKEVVGPHADKFIEPLAHLFRRTVDTRGIGSFGV